MTPYLLFQLQQHRRHGLGYYHVVRIREPSASGWVRTAGMPNAFTCLYLFMRCGKSGIDNDRDGHFQCARLHQPLQTSLKRPAYLAERCSLFCGQPGHSTPTVDSPLTNTIRSLRRIPLRLALSVPVVHRSCPHTHIHPPYPVCDYCQDIPLASTCTASSCPLVLIACWLLSSSGRLCWPGAGPAWHLNPNTTTSPTAA